MADVELLNMHLLDTFQSMKREGLVDEHFAFVYSLKENIADPFYLEVIPEFCTNVRDVLKLLAQKLNDSVVINYNLMKEFVFKVKGSSLSMGASRMALAFTDFEAAIDMASKEECLKALNRAQREYTALEEKLHICLQLERRIVISAASL